MLLVNYLLIIWFALVSFDAKASQPLFERSLGVSGGMLISDGTGDLLWYGVCVSAPNVPPGIDAPIGSNCHQNGSTTKWEKIGSQPTDWQQEGLDSQVYTQVMSFGKSGNATNNSFLNRAGNVPSNVSGVISLLSGATLRSMGCGSQNPDTYNVLVYEHEGDYINPILKYTFVVTTSRNTTIHTLNIAFTQDKQIALKMSGSTQDIGCNLIVRGVGL